MILNRPLSFLGIALSAFALSATPLKAQAPKQPSTPLIDFQNGGTLVGGNTLSNVTSTGWNQLNTYEGNTRVLNNDPVGSGGNASKPYGGHGTTTGWYVWDSVNSVPSSTKSTIASNLGDGTGALWKSGGLGYVATASVHQGAMTTDFGVGGSFELSVTAIDDLNTVVFQIQATNRINNGDKFVFSSLPTLVFGEITLEADFDGRFARENNFSAGFGGQDMDSYAFQWDLSEYEITGGEDFIIRWTGLSNSGIFGLQVDQSDAFVQVVPEPTSIALLAIGAGALLWRRKFRRAA